MTKKATTFLLSHFQETDTREQFVGCCRIHVVVWYINFLVLELAFTSIFGVVYACTVVSLFDSTLYCLARTHLAEHSFRIDSAHLILHAVHRLLCNLHGGTSFRMRSSLVPEGSLFSMVLVTHQTSLPFRISLGTDQLFCESNSHELHILDGMDDGRAYFRVRRLRNREDAGFSTLQI